MVSYTTHTRPLTSSDASQKATSPAVIRSAPAASLAFGAAGRQADRSGLHSPLDKAFNQPPRTKITVSGWSLETSFTCTTHGGKCSVYSYTAGQVFSNNPNRADAVNNGGVPAVLAVTYLNVPHGGSNRIERTNLGNCPC
jgi:hypothetical protein